MNTRTIRIVLPAAFLASASLPAAASGCQSGVVRPYVIEKTCNDDGSSCKARLLFAPGQNSGLAGHGSYWYPRAVGYVRVSSSESCGRPSQRRSQHDEGGDGYPGPQHPAHPAP